MTNSEINIDQEELQEIGDDLQYEMEQMFAFERKLHTFDPDTLILFIVLTVETRRFDQVLRILEVLDEIDN